MRTTLPILATLACLFAAPTPARALAPVHAGKDGVALGGHDAVSYFRGSGAPAAGRADLAYNWRDATWHFTSDENRRLFAADPERNAPQFGGYCAWAVSQGYTAPGDPLVHAVVDGKLYLNYNRQAADLWNADRRRFIAQGEANWPRLLAGR
jgi:hypothetical protein